MSIFVLVITVAMTGATGLELFTVVAPDKYLDKSECMEMGHQSVQLVNADIRESGNTFRGRDVEGIFWSCFDISGGEVQ